jgi:hypothetical protein
MAKRTQTKRGAASMKSAATRHGSNEGSGPPQRDGTERSGSSQGAAKQAAATRKRLVAQRSEEQLKRSAKSTGKRLAEAAKAVGEPSSMRRRRLAAALTRSACGYRAGASAADFSGLASLRFNLTCRRGSASPPAPPLLHLRSRHSRLSDRR